MHARSLSRSRDGLRALKLSASGVLTLMAGLMAAGPAAAAVETFSYTGGQQSFIVPAGVTSVEVTAVGGTGAGTANAAGGGGSILVTPIKVAPGETLYVEVGGNGGASGNGFNGGGAGGSSTGSGAGGQGGGASDVRRVPVGTAGSLASRAVIAAGGGGAGGLGSGAGGPGDSPGTSCTGCGLAGLKGTFAAGGAAVGNGTAGVLGQGGQGGPGAAGPGGGGAGGGYNGGSGGAAGDQGGGGGGGGASYPNNTDSVRSLDSTATPKVTITYTPVGRGSLSPSTLNFPARRLGTASPDKAVTVTNKGSAALTLSGAYATGPNAADFLVGFEDCAEKAIAPLATCSIRVAVKPLAVGPRTATLVVTINGDDPLSIPLNAEGVVDPPVSPTPPGTKPGGTTPKPPTVLPSITGLALTNKTFRTGARPPGASKKVKTGTATKLTLSVASTLTIWIDQVGKGRRDAGKCKKQTTGNAKKPSCTLYTNIGSITSGTLDAGPQQYKLPAKFKTKKLKLGRYRIGVQAKSTAGKLSPIVFATFKVVR